MTAAAAAGAACGRDAAPTDASVEGASVTVGTAAQDGSGFVPLAGDVVLVPGAQGGFHVWMKYRVVGLGAETVDLAYTIRRASDARLVLTATRQQALGELGDGGFREGPAAIPAFMCPSPLGVQVRDELMHLQLDISRSTGAPVGQVTADFTPHCPDGDQATHCAGICSG